MSSPENMLCATMNGVPPHMVMKWTGHDSIQMVMHYAEASGLADSLKAFAAMPENGENMEKSKTPNTQVPNLQVVA